MTITNSFQVPQTTAASAPPPQLLRATMMIREISSHLCAISSYLLCGFIHELSHIAAASIFAHDHFQVWKDVDWLDVLLHRRFQIESSLLVSNNTSLIVRHFGWITSISIAIIISLLKNQIKTCIGGDSSEEEKKPTSKFIHWMELAAFITAIDAIWTDLFQMNPLFPFDYYSTNDNYQQGLDDSKTMVFFCGNFGIIILHSAWLDDNGGSSALGILKKMIEVTMMRGAQTGGVVTFRNDRQKDEDGNYKLQMKSIRSRVVKSKRGDLSKMLATKLKRDAFKRPIVNMHRKSKTRQYHADPSVSKRQVLGDGEKHEEDNGEAQHLHSYHLPSYEDVQFFAGHTRFATSSKANLDGTHPHQWTPPKYYRVYNFNKSNMTLNQKDGSRVNIDLSLRFLPRTFIADSPIRIQVENFITHNGDFESYELNGYHYDTEAIQAWLSVATGSKMPTVVDSCAIAGMVDLIRCKGCFSLACRYVVCLGLPTSTIGIASDVALPHHNQYDTMGRIFEESLHDLQQVYPLGLCAIGDDEPGIYRDTLVRKAIDKLNRNESLRAVFRNQIRNGEDGASTYSFARAIVNAFFDNDLFHTVKILMKNASGSFGLCVMSSLDVNSQMCIASRGQTMSIAFYPQKQLICYGSEQAAVKAGMLYKFPGSQIDEIDHTHLSATTDVQRLDLDDVGGEIALLDWSTNCNSNPVSRPNRGLQAHRVMNNKVRLFLFQESTSHTSNNHLYQRMTKLTKNPLILPLKEDCDDPILQDLRDIPRICADIQSDWKNTNNNAMFSLNRLTAVNLGRRLKHRLRDDASGSLHHNKRRVDILLTGCEVSLWLAEQFASDLLKAFPHICIKCISSNKLLGLFGQDESIGVPSIGFPHATNNLHLEDAIVIIVSHSGGTFGPLSCASLLQSVTKNIFVVTSEWDTQIGKQLRSMRSHHDGQDFHLDSHIFTTGVGIRTAEPCSISVVATHQLLTNIFQYISTIILNNEKIRQLSGAMITEQDIQILERCNNENIFALEDIVGVQDEGTMISSNTEKELRKAGNVWAEHVLENAKAYILSFLYIFATVITGYPLVSGIARSIGLSPQSKFSYVTSLFDAMIYFFLPQINILIIRVIQKRPLLHRMVGRTVVIGDIPWVAQSAEAFLSKIFACSYSIAGLNVHSGNPNDHLVHRMTHRVCRGTLLCCGRPDGRLSALTASENAVCLSVNQACSIQSLGSNCESVTIGHNKFKLPLSTRAIYLSRNRPLFLCEYLLAKRDHNKVIARESTSIGASSGSCRASLQEYLPHMSINDSLSIADSVTLMDSIGKFDHSCRKQNKTHTSAALLGHYKSMEKEMVDKIEHDNTFLDTSQRLTISKVLDAAIQEKKWLSRARGLFDNLNLDQDGKLKIQEFVEGIYHLNSEHTKYELSLLFARFDEEGSNFLLFDDFFNLMSMLKIEVEQSLHPIRDSRGLIQVGASQERFFGEKYVEKAEDGSIKVSPKAMKSQNFVQELYESRIASLQRFVSMTVMFHQMGLRVSTFFSKISLGLLGYRMDRSHSIMRIATTASPISGAEIRDRAEILSHMKKVNDSLNTIAMAWLRHKENTREEKYKNY